MKPQGSTDAPTCAIYVELEAMNMASVRPLNPAVSRREALRDLWEKIGLGGVETRVIRIPVSYTNFDDFWDSITVPIRTAGHVDRRDDSKRA